MVSKTRAVRIAERVREELSELLVHHVSDPRLSGVSVTDVEIDKELSYATIYFSCVEGSSRAEEIKDGFVHAVGFLRSELARRVDLRSFPRLRFQWDPTFERAEHIESLFHQLEQEKQNKPTPMDGETPDA